MDCIFCDRSRSDVKDDILFESSHFYVKACLASITPGHVLLISKDHYSCFGDLPPSLYEEFTKLKDILIQRIGERFCEPFLLEHGLWGQSVAHAHFHFTPLSGEGYTIPSIFEEMVYSSGVRYREGGLETLKDVFSSEGEYLAVGERERMFVCCVAGFSEEEWMGRLGYRQFFQRKGLDVPVHWKYATVEHMEKDKEVRALTKKVLGF